MQILLADNQSQVRFGLRVLLQHQPGIQIVGEAATARDLLTQSKTACPDLILLDWKLPKMQATKLLTALRTVCPCALVIVLSGLPEDREPALTAGADGFVGKYELPEQLLAAIAKCDGSPETCCTDRAGGQEEGSAC